MKNNFELTYNDKRFKMYILNNSTKPMEDPSFSFVYVDGADNILALLDDFVPDFHSNIMNDEEKRRFYANKYAKYATVLCLKNSAQNNVGFVSCYLNDKEQKIAYISCIVVKKNFNTKDLGSYCLNTRNTWQDKKAC